MKVGDLIRKKNGVNAGKVGVITRVYKGRNAFRDSKIFDVLSEGKFEQWSSSWCEQLVEKKE